MIANIINKNFVRILSYFFISPGSRYKRKELKEKTGMHNVPLDNSLQKLLSLKILKEKNKLYSLNNENEEINSLLELMRGEQLRLNIPYSIFNLLIEISEKLSIKGVKSVILFGSYAKLIYADKSDIDIAILTEDKISKTKLESTIKKIIFELSKKRNKKIEAHFFSEQDFKKGKEDPLIKDIIRNGKIIL